MNFKTLVLGILLIVLLGMAGFLYRAVTEKPKGPVACTTDARLCPDGTALGRTGPSCTFPSCPPPNIELSAAGITFALPPGYTPISLPDTDAIAAFSKTASTTESNLIIRQFTLDASTTAADFIRSNAVLSPSDMKAPATAFSSITLGPAPGHQFSVVTLERFEGVVDTVYYLKYENKVFRFDAISRGADWTNPDLDVSKLPATVDLRAALTTLQGI